MTPSNNLDQSPGGCKAHLGPLRKALDAALERVAAEGVIDRIWAEDHTVWKEGPSEIVNRLGWLKSPDVMKQAIPDITAFAGDVRDAGCTRALLLGMGGSSLAPETFYRTFGTMDGYMEVHVLDSTDPGAVLHYDRNLPPEKTLFIVSTKSGGTVETLSLMKYFYNRVARALGPDAAGAHFAAVTDPGSRLEATAGQLNFRKVFLNDPNIGGRYSALSYFGLVPASLLGIDLELLLERAAAMAGKCRTSRKADIAGNPGAWLGCIMGELAKTGRDKVTFFLSPELAPFGAWVEQLIAESTGKEGKGILPVDGEPLGDPETYGGDRLFIGLKLEGDPGPGERIAALIDAGHPVVEIALRDVYDLGGEFFRWEMAVAVAGHVLGINPFDQPDVESAKVLAREMVAAYRSEGRLPDLVPTVERHGIRTYASFEADSPARALRRFLDQAEPGKDETAGRSYVAVQAYVNPSAEMDGALQAFRAKIRSRCRLATTAGYGPRFLHSTGQLHKGDGGRGLFIQILGNMPEDAPIPDETGSPDSAISFGVLKEAQALGDRRALLDGGRNVIRFYVEGNIPKGVDRLTEAL